MLYRNDLRITVIDERQLVQLLRAALLVASCNNGTEVLSAIYLITAKIAVPERTGGTAFALISWHRGD